MSGTSPEPSPLERMMAAWVADRERGELAPVEDYLRLFEASAPPEEPESPAEEPRFGLYRLLRVLGQGGQGTVWLAEDSRLGRRVALKLLPPQRHGSHLHFERFRREAQVASRLDHPAICAVYETGTEDDVPFIAMRWVDGETLAERLRTARREAGLEDGPRASGSATTRVDGPDGRVAEDAAGPAERPLSATASEDQDELLRCLEECARALHVAHEAGIVHRDFKPGNVMITAEGEPVIVDFGLARDDTLDDGLTRTEDVFGTPAYMAPEQIEGVGRRVDRRADVWALGVTLYEGLALERPFRGTTQRGLQREILEGEPPPLRRRNRAVPRDLEVVVATALEKDPERRYATALALAEDLRCVRERRPVAARPAGPGLRLRRWMQRNPLLAGAVGVAVLAVILGLLASLLSLREAVLQLRDYESLRDGRRARAQVAALEALWPAVPERVAAMDSWLEAAEALEAALPAHRRRLAELETAAAEDERARLRRPVLAEVISELEGLAARIPELRARRALAAGLERDTVQERAAEWDAAITAVARDPRYGGLRLRPRVGLVPLGPDPRSGLQEFAHRLSGGVPERDAAGALVLEPGCGLVLVLVPGGDVTLGYQTGDPAAPNHVRPERVPFSLMRQPAGTRSVRLEPFYLSRYEMTQDQWERATGENPSLHAAPRGGVSPLHPVERVSWPDAVRVLGRLDLELPLEAWWERAARADTPGLWWTGSDGREAAGRSNTADRRFATAFPGQVHTPVDDGWVFHAPVTALEANPFGFHGMIGNVAEWCRDPFTPGDPPSHYVTRGSHFGSLVEQGCTAARGRSVPHLRSPTLGLRPAASLAP